jgi:hypothetical protein
MKISFDVTGLPDPLVCDANAPVSIKARTDQQKLRYLRKYRNIQRRSVLDFDLPTHIVQARDVNKGDWLLLPSRQNLLPTELTPEQLYVAGFWLAEGHHLKESNKEASTYGDYVGICFTNTNPAYLTYAQDVLRQWFPRSASNIRVESVKNAKHAAKYVLSFRSRKAVAYFRTMFGEYSHGKSIAPSLYNCAKLLPLICGYIDGDGCQFAKGRRAGEVVLVTTSQTLIKQFHQILIDEQIWAVLQYQDHSNPNHRRTYRLTITPTYVHRFSSTATKVVNPGAGRTNNLAIPTPEGVYTRVKQVSVINT